MTLAQETEMSADEIDAFLSENETGVLSLARAEEPYAIPISYGYDSDARTFYLRLVSQPDSKKRQFLSTSPDAHLVIYDETADGTTYWSVIASGVLEEVSPDDLSVQQIEQYGKTQRPLFEIWGAQKDELEIQLYELVPGELSGRRTDVDRE